MSWILLMLLLGFAMQTQLIHIIDNLNSDSYAKSLDRCESKVSETLMGVVCGDSLYYGLLSKVLNKTSLTSLPSRGTGRFLIIDNTVLSFGTRQAYSKEELTMNITQYIIRGRGEDPSFEARYTHHIFQENITDGNFFHVKANSTNFVFGLMQIISDDFHEVQGETINRKYFDPFDRRIIQEIVQHRYMLVYVYDQDNREFIKISQIDFSEFHSVSDWTTMQISYLTRLDSNRLVFMMIFDSVEIFLLANEQDSLIFKVIYHSQNEYKIRGISSHHGYVYMALHDDLIIYRLDEFKIRAMIKSSDIEVKICQSNRDFIILKQKLPLTDKMTGVANLGMKLYFTDYNMMLIVLTFDKSVSIIGNHLIELDNQKDTLQSQFYEIGAADLNSRILDFHVHSKKLYSQSNSLISAIEELLVVGQDDDGRFVKYSIPFCAPNLLLTLDQPNIHNCRSLTGIMNNSYTLGLQTNEIKQCSINAVTPTAAFLCKDVVGMINYSLEKVELAKNKIECAELPSLEKPDQPPSCFLNNEPTKIQCGIFNDCYKCSMVGQCIWTNDNHTCIQYIPNSPIADLQSQEIKYFDRSLYETGNLALDLASFKIHAFCPMREDIDINSYQGDSYVNVSINNNNENETVFVVVMM